MYGRFGQDIRRVGKRMISIIMPLYNAEAFLEEAINSIRNQSYKDFELLCINDASEDSTVRIVEEAMSLDKRIKLFHNDIRSGAAVSRNKGIKHAKGEYITFLDGDDVFEEEMLDKAYSLAKERDLDIVIYEFLHVVSEKIHEKKTIYRNENYKRKYCSKPFCILDLEPEDYITWSNGPWNKLFKKEFINRNGLEFQSLSSSNDVYFVEMSFLLAERMMFLDDERVMVYVRDHLIPTRISYSRDPMCTYYACHKILVDIEKRNKMEELGQYFFLKCYFMFLGAMAKTKTEEKKQLFYEFLQTEGIRNLKKSCGEDYKQFLSIVRDNLEQFEKKDYGTKWFEDENMVSYFVRKLGKKIIKLFEDNSQVVIWGTGNYGKSLIKFVESQGLTPIAIVDMNEKKQGNKIGKFLVVSNERIDFSKVDVVIVAAKGAYDKVKYELEQYDLRIVDLAEHVGI